MQNKVILPEQYLIYGTMGLGGEWYELLVASKGVRMP